MIFNHPLQDEHAGHIPPAGILNKALFPPTAADVLSFLQYTMEPAVGNRLIPVVKFAGKVPAYSGNMLEVHFNKKENNVDFAARLHAYFDKEIVAGVRVKRQQHLPPFIPGVYASLIEQNKSRFAHGIENIWVEYDAPFNGTPAVFFDISRNHPFCPEAAYDCLQQVTSAAGYCINGHLPKFLEQIRQAGLYIVYYGLMFSRESHSIRLTINGITAARLADALAGLGWKGNYRALEKIRSTYLSGEQKLVVGVDFGNCLENRIGIEVFDGNEAAFIRKLYYNRHISQADCRLLSAWKQSLTLPDNLSTALTNLHQRPVSNLYTRLNHFKFVLDDTEVTTAKGYLYYCF